MNSGSNYYIWAETACLSVPNSTHSWSSHFVNEILVIVASGYGGLEMTEEMIIPLMLSKEPINFYLLESDIL